MRALRLAAFFLLLLLLAACQGRKVQVSENEEIFYQGAATEEQAKAVGESLTQHGLLNGSNPASIQLDIEGEKTILRFVVKEGLWEDEMMVESFGDTAYKVSQEVFEGKEITVELCDDHFNSKNSFPMAEVPVMRFGPDESIIYQKKLGQEKAAAVGEVLKSIGYFSGDNTATVQLREFNDGYQVMFVVQDGFWDKEELYPQWESLREQLSAALEGKPVTLDLCDDSFTSHKTFGPK